MGSVPIQEGTLRVLDAPALEEILVGQVQTPMGAATIRARRPLDDVEEIERRQQQIAEARDRALALAYVSLGGAEPLGDVLDRSGTEGVVLEPADLLRVAATVAVARRARAELEQEAERWPHLAAEGEGLPDLADLGARIDGVLDPEGQILDDASPELKRIRGGLRDRRSELRSRLEALVRKDELQSALQEPLVTERGGRYVVPLRSGSRGRIEGVVHDTSGSGQTLYVEPLETVDAQNRLAELERREEREVRRILLDLSGHVRAAAEGLRVTEEILGRLDAIQGLARWADEWEAVRPRLVDRGLRLRGACHPLMDREGFVPLDLELEPDVGVLVITGPNTGGKTVALKTVGLLVLLAQRGIPVPAREAVLPVVPRLHADIGDEQSITTNLSTFSAHLKRIVSFVEDCPAGSLVLLDELGTGTDPAEGAALGIALVERFLERQARVLLSTHHDAVKSFAHAHDRAVNAAMEFDPESLAPTYRMRVGRPGRSNALEVASGLGLDPDLVRRARSFLSEDALQLDEVIRRLETEAEEVEEEREALLRERQEQRRAARELEEAERRRRESWERLERQARQVVEEVVEDLKERAAARLQEIEREETAASSDRARDDRRARWAAVGGSLRGEAMESLRRRLAEARPDREAPGPEGSGAEAADGEPTEELGEVDEGGSREPLQRGDEVEVSPFGLRGTVLRPGDPDGDDDLEVDVGGKRMIVDREQVSRVAPASKRRRGGGTAASYTAAKEVKPEVHLRGMTVEEALEAADKYLDDALLAGLSRVRIIHGYGTLRLRDAIHGFLREHPRVREFGAAGPGEGGAGATVAELEV